MGPFFLLGFSTPGSMGPGASALIVARPQLPCRLQGLIVDEDCARNFDLEDLRIGKNSKFISAAPLPLAPYGVRHSLLEHYLRADRFGELRLWDMGHVLTHQDVTLAVKNTSRDAWRFGAHLLCQACDPREGTRLFSAVATDKGCAGCRASDTLTTLSAGIAWCHLCGSLVVEHQELRDKLRQAGARD